MDLTRAGLAAASALALASVVSLPGCSSSAGTDGSATTDGSAATSRPGPPALSAVLYQSRMDLDDRQVQVKVRNEGTEEVVVEAMTLHSSAFDAPMDYRKHPATVRGGHAVDLPVVLSDPVCDGAAAGHTARVGYRLEDGSSGTVDVPAVDERAVVADLRAAECFVLEVQEVATLSFRGPPRLVPRGDVLTAELTVDVRTIGRAEGSVKVLHVPGTTLLQHVDPTTLERLPDGLAPQVRAPVDGTESFTLTLVPNRCDAHAIADDKQGTRFRVLVEHDGTQGLVPLVSPDPVKVALYDFVRQACR